MSYSYSSSKNTPSEFKIYEPPAKMLGIDLLWTIAVARLIFGAEMSVQAPPNLSPGGLQPIANAADDAFECVICHLSRR